jgi:hypothetical protein
MKTTNRILKPATSESRMLCQPIAPCEILDGHGSPGLMQINGVAYVVDVIGHLPEVGEPVVDGYRLTKQTGEVHDLCLVAGALECTCGDYEFRRASRDPKGCKHVQAARRHLMPPRDLNPAPVYVGNQFNDFDDP